MWTDVRDPHNPRRILFRYDPATDTVEVKHRGEPAVQVKLEQVRQPGYKSSGKAAGDPTINRREDKQQVSYDT